ncbi:hypothetical protein COO60DRAFT_1457619 [Scenedesmus sp. NREL 46B-D3]|nr:hypothetical protein COO60DRAFT_1457619 [Scenedesmus sp. NREL 46B-D3]
MCPPGAWLASLLLLSVLFSGSALRTLDELQPVKNYARRTSNDQLRSSLAVSMAILQRHNRVRDSQPLQQYINHLEQLLQQDCCDYFAALPLVDGLTIQLKEVLDRRLPQELQPALRRSYICAIWLLQRSRQFIWNTNRMHKPALAGFMRPISFHHISKSGGTSMCQLARVNGCQGPLMTRADNCLLNKGMDGPIWVMKHDPLADNGIPKPPPPPPPAPAPPPPPPLSDIFGDDANDPEPADKAGGSKRQGTRHTARSANDDGDSRWGDDDDDDDEQLSWSHPGAPNEHLFMDAAAKAAGTLAPVPVEAMHWFMYDCNSMPKDKEGYGCGERQEAATAKSATFFANEHTLSLQHGEPRRAQLLLAVELVQGRSGWLQHRGMECACLHAHARLLPARSSTASAQRSACLPAFTNLVMVREPLSEAVSLMSEVRQVYDRLLRRMSIQYVITPLLPGHKVEQRPPSKAIAVAEIALQRVNKTKVTVLSNATAGGHVVVRVEVPPGAAAVRYTSARGAVGVGSGSGAVLAAMAVA